MSVFGRRHKAVCSACEAPLPRSAAWCGECGERVVTGTPALDPTDEPAHAGVQDVPAEPEATSVVGRRVAAGSVLLGVAVAAVVGLGGVRGNTGRNLLGVVGQHANVSSTAPPPDGLRLAWAREAVDGGDRFGYDPSSLGVVVAGDGRATLGPFVVDTATGEVVGSSNFDSCCVQDIPTRIRVTLNPDGRSLAFVDRLTGRRVKEVELDLPLGSSLSGGVAARAGDVTLLAGSLGTADEAQTTELSLLVTDDGQVVERLDGISQPYQSRVQGDTPYVVLEEGSGASNGTEDASEPGRSVVLDMRTGERVLEVVHPLPLTTIDVAAGLALVARSSDGRNVTGVGIAWEVEVVDLDSGGVVATFLHESGDAPTLVGRTSQGVPVVGLRRGSELVAAAAGPDGLLLPEVVVSAGRQGMFTGESPAQRATAQRFAFSDDVLIVADGDAGEVRAQALDGTVRWRVAAGDVAAVAVGDGFVSFSDGRDGLTGQTAQLRLLRLADGGQVASVTSGEGATVRPVLADTGVVGTAVTWPYSRNGWELTSQLQWTRVLDGAVRTSVQVVVPWVVAGTPGPTSSTAPATTASEPVPADDPSEVAADRLRDLSGVLHGFAPALDGPARPVVTRGREAGAIEVLEQDGSWRVLEPDDDPEPSQDPAPEGIGEPYGFYLEAVDADTERLLVAVQAFEGTGDAIVLGFDGEHQLRIEELYPLALVEGLVVGQRSEPPYVESRLVAVDAVTGEERWNVDADRGLFGFPLVDRRGLAFGDAFTVRGIDLESGEPWAWSSEDQLERLVAMSERHVFVRTSFGEVIAVDRETGTETWRTHVGVGLPEASTVAGGHLLVGTRDGLVVQLDEGGEVVQRVRASAEPIEGLAVVDGTVVVTTRSRILGLRRDGRGLVEQDQVDLP